MGKSPMKERSLLFPSRLMQVLSGRTQNARGKKKCKTPAVKKNDQFPRGVVS